MAPELDGFKRHKWGQMKVEHFLQVVLLFLHFLDLNRMHRRRGNLLVLFNHFRQHKKISKQLTVEG